MSVRAPATLRANRAIGLLPIGILDSGTRASRGALTDRSLSGTRACVDGPVSFQSGGTGPEQNIPRDFQRQRARRPNWRGRTGV